MGGREEERGGEEVRERERERWMGEQQFTWQLMTSVGVSTCRGVILEWVLL